ncbi:Tyrosine-protein phosphatase YwqE [Acholeplasma hippikon]|uniref:protein-tyrosine-phosphatase n=1 Tax=Acholeplasma hippikon TaxID=264636 RepID=A0A449BLI4_9MOLU|nr:Tyrosine-protein phosphatase YwqE [Acholeplasma hippikon]
MPNVDDGAKSYEEALEMLKMELAGGVKRVVLTPHVQNRVQKVSSHELERLFNDFKAYVSKHLPEMKLYLGAEVKYDEFKDTDYDRYTIKGTNYLLIEFSQTKEENIVDVLYNLISKGYQPILAHVERYTYLSVDQVKRIKSDGSWIQVNSGAVLGKDGFKYKHLAMKYIKLGLIDFIASDAHDIIKRTPSLQQAIKKVSKKFKMREIEIWVNTWL